MGVWLLFYCVSLEAGASKSFNQKALVIEICIIKGDKVKSVKFKMIFMTMTIFHVKARASLNNFVFSPSNSADQQENFSLCLLLLWRYIYISDSVITKGKLNIDPATEWAGYR